MNKIIKILKLIDLEALFWLSAFAYLTFIDPYAPKDLDLCLFSLAGIENCPGCGLGKSISMVFHGDIVSSFNSHPLGIPAIILIVQRIFRLIKNRVFLTNKMEVYSG